MNTESVRQNARLLLLEEAGSGLTFNLTTEERAQAAQLLSEERYQAKLSELRDATREHSERLDQLAAQHREPSRAQLAESAHNLPKTMTLFGF